MKAENPATKEIKARNPLLDENFLHSRKYISDLHSTHSLSVIIYSLVLCNRSLTCLTTLSLDVFPLEKCSETQVGEIPDLPSTSFSLIA